MKWLFAHGAGAGHDHPFMQAWSAALAPMGEVIKLTYPYMSESRRMPDRQPVLLAHHVDAIDAIRDAHPDERLVLIGKSMGSKIGCLASLERPVDGLVCLGFPLVSASGKSREQILLDLTTPVHLVQGTRDKMAPIKLLNAVRGRMTGAQTSLHIVQTGDHSLVTTKTHQRTQSAQDSFDQALASVQTFASNLERT